MTTGTCEMGRVNKRTWFCTEKERERRQTVSRRLQIRLAISKDHSYSKLGYRASDNQPNSTPPSPHVPDIGHVNDDIIIDGDISSKPDSTWSTGRRIMELGYWLRPSNLVTSVASHCISITPLV